MKIEQQASSEYKEKTFPFLFHHAVKKAEYCSNKIMTAAPISKERFYDEREYKAYEWLIEQVGFTPLFVSVGNVAQSLRVTGYPDPNQVLFSFSEMPNGIYTSYSAWERLFLHGKEDAKKDIFPASQTQEEWLQQAKEKPASIQMLVPSIDLSTAKKIYVPNKHNKWLLEQNGFSKVSILPAI